MLRFLLPLVIAVLSGQSALAHAIVIASTPKPGAVLSPGPVRIELRYNSRIDHKRSTLTLFAGESKTGRPVAIDATEEVDRLLAHLDDLAPGKYRMRWVVLALDGHITQGDVNFTINAP